jgi:threonine dehydrogenase-like Zn-dependent dehydrogenase
VNHTGDPTDVAILGLEYFLIHGVPTAAPPPVPPLLPDLIDRIWKGTINPGKVFDQTLPLEQVADGYRAMEERRAIKTLLMP